MELFYINEHDGKTSSVLVQPLKKTVKKKQSLLREK